METTNHHTNHFQHQQLHIISKLQQWVNSLICKGNEVHFIALEKSRNTEIELCSDILRFLDEYNLSQRRSSTTQNPLESEQRIEEEAKISVQERMMSMVEKWVRQNSSTTINGLNTRLHLALSLFQQLKSLHDRNEKESVTKFLYDFAKNKLVPSATSWRDFLQRHQVFHRDLMTMTASDEEDKTKEELLLYSLLVRLTNHYHGGELLVNNNNNKSGHPYSYCDAFFISIPNHAALLAVEAWHKMILNLGALSIGENDFLSSFIDYLKNGNTSKAQKNKTEKDLQFLQNLRFLSNQKKILFPRCISIPHSSSPSCEPRVLSGFVSYVLTPEQILSSSNNKQQQNQEWETNFDTSSDAWRLNHNFASGVGIVSKSFLTTPKYYSASSNNNGQQETRTTKKGNIRVCALSRIILLSNQEETELQQQKNTSTNQWKRLFCDALRNNRGDESTTTTTPTICFINSSSFDLPLEMLAEVLLSLTGGGAFIRLPASQFERVVLSLELIPDVLDLSSSTSEQIEFQEINNISLNLFFCGSQPDFLFSSRGRNSVDKGYLLQIVSASSSSMKNTEIEEETLISSIFSPARTTVIFYRRVVAQLGALQNHFERIWNHLVSCLFITTHHSATNNDNDDSDKNTSTLPTLVKGGGLIDCFILHRLGLSSQNQSRAAHNASGILLLQNSIRSYLVAMNRDARSDQTEEKINKIVALFGDEDENDKKVVRLGPLCSDDDDDDFIVVVDVLQDRITNIKKGIEFALFLSSIVSIERSWSVDFDVDDYGKWVVKRTLEFR